MIKVNEILKSFFPSNFYPTCVEVVFTTSLQIAEKWFLTSTQVVPKLAFNIWPIWTEVGFWTSDQVGRKWVWHFTPTCREVPFWKFCPSWTEFFSRYNSCHVGTDFDTVDFSLENVLTSRGNFSAQVDFCLLKFWI